MVAETPAAPKPDPMAARRHAREKYRHIYAPMILAACGLAMFLVVLVIVFTGAIEQRFSIVADTLLVCFTLMPCILGVLILFLLMAFMAFGANRLNHWLPAGVFARVRALVDRLDGFVKTAAGAATRPVIELNTRLTYGERFIDRLISLLTSVYPKERSTDERE